jgi:hypothetical protein
VAVHSFAPTALDRHVGIRLEVTHAMQLRVTLQQCVDPCQALQSVQRALDLVLLPHIRHGIPYNLNKIAGVGCLSIKEKRDSPLFTVVARLLHPSSAG